MKTSVRSSILISILLTGSALAQSFVMPKDVSEAERKRLERFKTFQIKGVCGEGDMDRLSQLGVNTVRGYTIPSPEDIREKLDHAQRLGMKMVVSEWMPNQGKNKGRDGLSWDFDYNSKADEMVEIFIRKVEAIGDHPAILMWGLGNEVHLDEPYLRVVNRMSLAIHERFPNHLTSLTVVNAKEPAIAAIKKFAPDLDVLGVQSYSKGAVRGAIKKTEALWGKPFYMSEFNTNGPWNFPNTEWGVALDEPVTKKVSDLKDCYAAIDASPLCLGSTIFIWGHATPFRPTYFSLLLDPEPNGQAKKGTYDHLMMTPQAEVMIEHFTRKPIRGNRAPVLSKLEFDGGEKSKLAKPEEPLNIRFSAEDPDGDKIEFVTWILDSSARKTTRVAGPFPQASSQHAVINAPKTPGEYLILVYAQDNKAPPRAVLPSRSPARQAGPNLPPPAPPNRDRVHAGHPTVACPAGPEITPQNHPHHESHPSSLASRPFVAGDRHARPCLCPPRGPVRSRTQTSRALRNLPNQGRLR